MADRVIFRERAIQAYRQGTEKDFVPRLTLRPVIVCLWLLLAVLIVTTALAWFIRVPTYVGAQGTILQNDARSGRSGGTTAAALFLPADQPAHLRVGQAVHARIGSSGPSASGAVVRVEPGVISPDAARAKYRYEPGADTVRQPWTVAIVRLRQSLPPATYGGSILTARVETGSQRLVTLFTGLGNPVGGAS
ncbi:hypothetical protein FCH28_04605 [Streptomyces piniterrae]|uniref:Uncharacterized protein n=1 Tax=Streptomyces piniterrae TaxID=2571125 RepID=A0A4U0NQX9_9ACTN|nr:hypothetical protein [Streptomyces piniterrae]TJZ56810.1 hypothetical protein FCH28_04605 [Streptomyces piniterrae]